MTKRVDYNSCILAVRGYLHGAEGVVLKGGVELVRIKGNDTESVLNSLRKSVDEMAVVDTGDGTAAYPTTERYLAAFEALLPTMPETYRSMLRAHNGALGRTLTGYWLKKLQVLRDTEVTALRIATTEPLLEKWPNSSSLRRDWARMANPSGHSCLQKVTKPSDATANGYGQCAIK